MDIGSCCPHLVIRENMKHLILLSILFLFLFLSGCNKHTRISNLNTIEILKAEQAYADRLLNDPEVQSALADLEGDPIKNIEHMRLIAESGEKALQPVKDMLAIESTFLGLGDAESVEPDADLEAIMTDPIKAMGRIDFRTELANEEVKHHPSKRFLDSPLKKAAAGIIASLMAAATAYFGISKINSLKSIVSSVTEDRDKHKMLAKNSIHYAKDIEAHARDESLKGDALKQAINNSRNNSMQDQLKNGINTHMSLVMGEVKEERKS